MPILTRYNCRIDKSSGAIIFDGSPELTEIQRLTLRVNSLEKQCKDLTEKYNKLIEILEEGGKTCGGNRILGGTRFCPYHDT